MYRRISISSDTLNLPQQTVPVLARSHPPVIGRLNVLSLAALAGIIGPIVFFACDYTLALTATNYSFYRDTISSLALTEFGWVQTIGFLVMGLLMELYVLGLLFTIHPRRGFHLSAVLLVIAAFGLLMIGAFHCDITGDMAATLQGTIHGTVADIVFGGFPIAIFIMSFSIKRDRNWRGLYLYTFITGILGFLFVGLCLLVNKIAHNWTGGFERLLVANMIIWVEVTAIRLMLLALGKKIKLAQG